MGLFDRIYDWWHDNPSPEERRRYAEQQRKRENEQKWREEEAEKEKIGKFYRYFSMGPEKFKGSHGQINVMFKLNILAANARKQYANTVQLPDHIFYMKDYNEAVREYDHALDIARIFNPEFADPIPHWNKFVEFYDRWAEKNNIKP